MDVPWLEQYADVDGAEEERKRRRREDEEALRDGAEETKKKLAEMRTSLLTRGVSLQGVDDIMLLRFLRARSMLVPPASKMLAEHQTWRASFVPDGFIPESQIKNELAQSKAFLQGVIKKSGHPLLIMIARRHVCNRTDFQEFKRFVVYAADKTVASAAPGVEQYITIVDLGDIGYKNMDIKSLLTSVQLLQNYYPERLAKLYFVKVPSIFTSFWKMVSRFIDKVTREKIIFLDSNNTNDWLIEEFGADIIPKVYGGKAELISIQDAIIPNWPPTGSAA